MTHKGAVQKGRLIPGVGEEKGFGNFRIVLHVIFLAVRRFQLKLNQQHSGWYLSQTTASRHKTRAFYRMKMQVVQVWEGARGSIDSIMHSHIVRGYLVYSDAVTKQSQSGDVHELTDK